MRSIYRMIFDADVNPLRNLPAGQRFQLMVYLSFMWTAIFCASTSAWFWYGHLVAIHVLVLLGLLATGWTFRQARRTQTYRDYPRVDGTARYDDVWGG